MDRGVVTRTVPAACAGVLTLCFSVAGAAWAAEAPAVDRYVPRLVVESESSRERAGETQALPAFPFPVEGPLSLQTCVAIALDANPAARAAREGVRAAEEGTGEARSLYYPELSARASYRRWETHAFLPDGLARTDVPGTIGPTDDWSAGFETRYLLLDSGARKARLEAAKAREGRARFDERTIHQDLALVVHEAFFGLVAAEEHRGVAAQSLVRAQDHLRLAKERKEAGAVPRADVIRAQTRVSDARLALVRADSLVRIAQGRLNVSMGLPVTAGIRIDGAPAAVLAPSPSDVGAVIERAVRERSEIQAALREIAALRSQVDEARSAFGPRINLAGAYGLRDESFLPEDVDWSAGAFLELPLFKGFSRVHGEARSRAELARHEARTQGLVLAVQEQVWSAWSRLLEAREATESAEALVEEAREGLRLTRERYEAGADTVTDLLDVQTALARAEAEHVGARWDYRAAHSRYRRSTGDLVVWKDP